MLCWHMPRGHTQVCMVPRALAVLAPLSSLLEKPHGEWLSVSIRLLEGLPWICSNLYEKAQDKPIVHFGLKNNNNERFATHLTTNQDISVCQDMWSFELVFQKLVPNHWGDFYCSYKFWRRRKCMSWEWKIANPVEEELMEIIMAVKCRLLLIRYCLWRTPSMINTKYLLFKLHHMDVNIRHLWPKNAISYGSN